MIVKLLCAVGLCAVPVMAQSISGSTLREQCEQGVKANDAKSSCAAYVRGMLDASRLWYEAMQDEKHFAILSQFYCAPDGMRAKDAAILFLDWIKKNSKYETQPAANAFVLAMREKYPCK